VKCLGDEDVDGAGRSQLPLKLELMINNICILKLYFKIVNIRI
jgi:hypothetical protein